MPKLQKSAAKAAFATFASPLQCDLRDSAARHNSITPAAACSCSSEETWRSLSTAICRHWVATRTLENALLCNTSLGCTSSNAQSISTHAKHNSTASTKKRKSHPEPSVPLRAQKEQGSTAKRRRPKPLRARANFSPQRKLRLPEKNTMFRANPNIQIASMMQQFQCNPPRMICKTQSESQDSTAEQLPFDQRWRWRSHSIAICRHWVATHTRTATQYSRTHRQLDLMIS